MMKNWASLGCTWPGASRREREPWRNILRTPDVSRSLNDVVWRKSYQEQVSMDLRYTYFKDKEYFLLAKMLQQILLHKDNSCSSLPNWTTIEGVLPAARSSWKDCPATAPSHPSFLHPLALQTSSRTLGSWSWVVKTGITGLQQTNLNSTVSVWTLNQQKPLKWIWCLPEVQDTW